MLTILIVVFLSIFLLTALLISASGAGASQRAQQTIAHLESALATSSRTSADQIVDVRKNELLSTVPLINRWLLQIELAPRIRMLLYQANLKWTTGGLLLITFVVFVTSGYLVYFRTGSAVSGLILGAIIAYAPTMYALRQRRKRFTAFEQGLPEALEMMVSALRAGHSLVAALRLVADESPDPIGIEFRICFEEQNYGLELRTALDNLVTRVPLQDLRIVATAILIQKESGGNLAELLEKAAHLIRERFKLKRQVRTHTAQGRLTGWILSLLPLVLGFLLFMVNPKTMSLLWTNPLGLKLLYLAIGMTVLGSMVIRKIVNMEV